MPVLKNFRNFGNEELRNKCYILIRPCFRNLTMRNSSMSKLLFDDNKHFGKRKREHAEYFLYYLYHGTNDFQHGRRKTRISGKNMILHSNTIAHSLRYQTMLHFRKQHYADCVIKDDKSRRFLCSSNSIMHTEQIIDYMFGITLLNDYNWTVH